MSFRPQQGLAIMNNCDSINFDRPKGASFRPQQGLAIMNKHYTRA